MLVPDFCSDPTAFAWGAFGVWDKHADYTHSHIVVCNILEYPLHSNMFSTQVLTVDFLLTSFQYSWVRSHPQESVQLAVLEGARVGSDKPLKKHARLRSEGLSSRESIGPSLAQMPRIAFIPNVELGIGPVLGWKPFLLLIFLRPQKCLLESNHFFMKTSILNHLASTFLDRYFPSGKPLPKSSSNPRPRRDALDKAEKSARTAIKLCTEHVPGLQLWSVLVVEGDWIH